MKKNAPIVSFANALNGSGFSWGTLDCNVVALKFLDMIMEESLEYTSITSEVEGQYSSEKGAYFFYRDYRLTCDEFLLEFSDKNPNKPKFQMGDIIIVPMKKYKAAHICIGGKSFSMDPVKGGVIVPTISLLRLPTYDIYRPRR